MPEVSPRRSSRARPVQAPSNKLTHQNSNSSTSSTKGARSSILNETGKSGVASPSDHSEELDHPEPEARQTRRSKRELNQPLEIKPSPDEDALEDEDGEEEVTRCLCGKLEYPGPPPALGLNDPDVGGMFIQCDKCHVWQHGGCVGIMNDDETPDDYFCEQCRPNLHRTFNGGRTQKYSRYLPVVEARASSPPRNKPVAGETDTRGAKDAAIKNAILQAHGRRRATMNSRAALEEDELIERAIEESKGLETVDSLSGGQRKGKRAREDSDESEHELKRRKTGSISPPDSSVLGPGQESDVEAPRPRSKTVNGKQRLVKPQQDPERDVKRREREREQERQAAANRRKGRADRRHVDDPDTPPEPNKPTPSSKSTATTQSRSAKTQANSRPQIPSPPPKPPALSHKKGTRPARRGKVGRNQYTRERDAAADARAEAARALHTRDGEDGASNDFAAQLLPNGSKPAKPKHMNPNRTSMNELRKRAAGILEFISRTQVEMAGDRTPSGSQTPPKGVPRNARGISAAINGSSKLSNEVADQDVPSTKETIPQPEMDVEKVSVDDFKTMSSLDMMDVLTREIVHWQHQHGKWGEK